MSDGAGTQKGPTHITARHRHTLSKKFKELAVPMKSRGAPDGPKRTPLHLADAWQKQDGYEVEKVGKPCNALVGRPYFTFFNL